MIAIFSKVVFDNKSSLCYGWTDEEYPDGLTNEQHKCVLMNVLKSSFTREMAEEGKSMEITMSKAGESRRLSYVFMPAAQRLAMKD